VEALLHRFTHAFLHQRRNVGGIPRAMKSLRAEPKRPNNVASTFFNSTLASEKPQVWKWGHQSCFLSWAPSNLVTSLLYTQCKTTHGLPQSTLSLSRCVTYQDVGVHQSHAGLPFGDFEQTQIAHQKNDICTIKTQKVCATNKNIWVCLFELKR